MEFSWKMKRVKGGLTPCVFQMILICPDLYLAALIRILSSVPKRVKYLGHSWFCYITIRQLLIFVLISKSTSQIFGTATGLNWPTVITIYRYLYLWFFYYLSGTKILHYEYEGFIHRFPHRFRRNLGVVPCLWRLVNSYVPFLTHFPNTLHFCGA